MTEPSDEAARPLLRIVRGNPTPQELAAVVAVVATRGGSCEAPAKPPASLWASKAAGLRKPIHPGPGAWAASAR